MPVADPAAIPLPADAVVRLHALPGHIEPQRWAVIAARPPLGALVRHPGPDSGPARRCILTAGTTNQGGTTP